MDYIEIITILISSSIVIIVIGNYIYKKIKHLPTGECACCAKKGNNLVKKYYRKYKKKESK